MQESLNFVQCINLDKSPDASCNWAELNALSVDQIYKVLESNPLGNKKFITLAGYIFMVPGLNLSPVVEADLRLKDPERACLIDYICLKSSRLQQLKRNIPPLVNMQDINEIKNWTREEVHKVFESIKRSLLSTSAGGAFGSMDIAMCPWCIRQLTATDHVNYSRMCVDCQYGARHGGCTEANNNTYSEILSLLPKRNIFTSLKPFIGELLSSLELPEVIKEAKIIKKDQNFMVGDVVYCNNRGKGIVTEIRNSIYPVVVKFADYQETYTQDGEYLLNSPSPTLHKVEEVQAKPFKLELVNGKVVYLTLKKGSTGRALLKVVDENGKEFSGAEYNDNLLIINCFGELVRCSGINPDFGLSTDSPGRLIIRGE